MPRNRPILEKLTGSFHGKPFTLGRPHLFHAHCLDKMSAIPTISNLSAYQINALIAKIHELIVSAGGLPASTALQIRAAPSVRNLIHLLFQLGCPKGNCEVKLWDRSPDFADAIGTFQAVACWLMTVEPTSQASASDWLSDVIMSCVANYLSLACAGHTTCGLTCSIFSVADRIFRTFKDARGRNHFLIPKPLHASVAAVKSYISKRSALFGNPNAISLAILAECGGYFQTISESRYPAINRLILRPIYDEMCAHYHC